MKSTYEELVRDWDSLVDGYLESLAVLRASTYNVLSLAWLTHKTHEAALIRNHGWTVLEFESAIRSNGRSPPSPPFPTSGSFGL